MVLLHDPNMHNPAHEWIGRIRKSHHYRIRLFDSSDSTPCHGLGRLHHFDPVEQYLAGQEDTPESVGDGCLCPSVSYPDPHDNIHRLF